MSDPHVPVEERERSTYPRVADSDAQLFAAPPHESTGRGKILAVGVAVLIAAAVLAFSFRGSKAKPAPPFNVVLPADPYAQNLIFSQLAMSESTSLSGGKSTFIDGKVKNTGPKTVTAVTVQVLFRNDVGLAPKVENLPLTLIRTHEPYVDTEAVSVAPLKPGDDAEFRLIFETVSGDWNQQMPEISVIHIAQR